MQIGWFGDAIDKNDKVCYVWVVFGSKMEESIYRYFLLTSLVLDREEASR